MLCNPSESLGVLTLMIPDRLSRRPLFGFTACDWLEAPLLGHSPCHRFIESCPQGVHCATIRVVMINLRAQGWNTNRAEQ